MTSIADNIREKMKKRNAITGGKTEALSQQAALSNTGKVTTAPSGQSSILESTAGIQAQEGLNQVEAQAEEAAAGIDIAQEGADIQQLETETRLSQQEAETQSELDNRTKALVAQLDQVRGKTELDEKALEIKNALQDQRLADSRYRRALTDAGNRKGLKSKMDFAREMSELGLARAKESAEDKSRMRTMMADHERYAGQAAKMDELEAAMQKTRDDEAAMQKQQKVGAWTTAGKAGIDMYSESVAKEQEQKTDLARVKDGNMGKNEYASKWPED